MSDFEKAKAKHVELMGERMTKKSQISRALEQQYVTIAETKRELLNQKISHQDTLEILAISQLELIRLFKESLK